MAEDLLSGIARVLTPGGGTAGTGFVVSGEGIIVTCAHVVRAAGVEPGGMVPVVFLGTEEVREAIVERTWWRSPEAEDTAFLRLQGALPAGVSSLSLGSSLGIAAHSFRTFGFPEPTSVEGLPGDGRIVGNTSLHGFPVWTLESSTVARGFSGAPVLDIRTGRVVGMITSIIRPDQDGRLAETAFATPTETLRSVCDALQVSDVCPYRSLNPFSESDAEFFFGRQRVVEKLIDHLRHEPRFLALLGPSGCGKTSLVQAGLIPQLRRGRIPGSDRWGTIVLRPTEQPFQEAEIQGLPGAVALPFAVSEWLSHNPDRTHLLLVIDQFEEILISCTDTLCQEFVRQLISLLESALPITVILVMRNDFYSLLARDLPALLPWVERGLLNVPLLIEQAEIRAIIEDPAQLGGIIFQAGLVESICSDVLSLMPEGEKRGSHSASTVLPLLEFTLTQLWERRRDGVLTHEAYQTIGGVTGGITQWADRVFHGLGADQQRLARRILTSLVHLGDESERLPDCGRRKSLYSLCRDNSEQESVHRLVRELANVRLLVTGFDSRAGEETVELVHDVLLREWDLLRRWLAEDRQFLAWRQRLEERLRAWQASTPAISEPRDRERLLQGRDLVEAEQWLNERDDTLTREEQGFISASADWAKRRRRQDLNRAWTIAAALLVLAAMALYLWHNANQQKEAAVQAQRTAKAEVDTRITVQAQLEAALGESEVQRQEADTQRLVAVARELAVQSEWERGNTNADLVLSTLLAIESLKRYVTVEGTVSLRHCLDILPRPLAQVNHSDIVRVARFSRDGRWAITAGDDGVVRVWDVVTGSEISRVSHDGWIFALALSPDEEWIASGGDDGIMLVWETRTGRVLSSIPQGGAVWAVGFSPDGQRVVSGGEGGAVRVWDVVTGEEIVRMMHDDTVYVAVFSRDGERIISAGADHTIRIWDATTGQELVRMLHDDVVWTAAIGPDGKRILSGSEDGTARVWDLQTGEELARMTHQWGVRAVDFSPNGDLVASAGWGGVVRTWDPLSGKEVARIEHGDAVESLAFSPDGQSVVSGSWDRTVRVWEARTGREIARMGHAWRVRTVAFNSDGRQVISGGWDGIAQVWELGARKDLVQMQQGGAVWAVGFSPDGQRVVSGGEGGAVRVWDVVTGEEIVRMMHDDTVYVAVFSRDGERIISAGADHTIRIWDATTGQELVRMLHDGVVHTVVVSPDGRWVLSGSEDGTARVWDLQTGEELARVTHGGSVWAVAFGPSGQLAASGGYDNVIRIWEPETGRIVARMLHGHYVSSVAFSADGEWIASGSWDRTARVWEAETGKELFSMEHPYQVYHVVLGPEKQWLASECLDGAIRVWDLQTRQEAASMSYDWHRAIFSTSSNGQYIISGGWDDPTVNIWIVRTGWALDQMPYEAPIGAVALSPDGKRAVAADMNGTIKSWLWQPEDLITQACGLLPRNLTRDEWQEFIVGEDYQATCPNLPVPDEDE